MFISATLLNNIIIGIIKYNNKDPPTASLIELPPYIYSLKISYFQLD